MIVHATPTAGNVDGSIVTFSGPARLTLDGSQKMDVHVQVQVDVAHQTFELTVVETEPGLKSATASSVTKPAKTETGLVVQVPPFINEGEKIRVDTSEVAYLSRA